MGNNERISVSGNGSQTLSIAGNFTSLYVRELSWSPSRPESGAVSVEIMDAGGVWRALLGGQLDLSRDEPIFPAVTGIIIQAVRLTVSGVPGGTTTTAELFLRYDPVTDIGRIMTTPAGFAARMKTDQAKTGFFEGREFRAFWEFNIPTGETQVLRATVSEDIRLFNTNLSLDQSRLRLTLRVGGTPPAGTWTPIADTTPAGGILRKNNMDIAPADPLAAVTIDQQDGVFTGGTVIDAARLLSEAVGGRASTVGGSIADERGVGPGTYYYVFENIDGAAATGVFSAFWEVRPTT